jgi:RIO-like serine/threonine protein kinase
MKLDANLLRYLTKDNFRVLTAIEMGMKNHEVVPVVMFSSKFFETQLIQYFSETDEINSSTMH